MKTKYTILAMALGLSFGALAQENDDMYFNAKDRAVVIKANEVVLAKKYRQDDMDAVRTNPVNPSDSYSGRGVNPEFNAQSKNGTTVVQNDPDYFVSGFQPKNVNSNLYNNASAYSNTYYNNPYGGYGGFGSPYGSGMYSPYAFGYSPYSMMYSPYSMYSPYGMYGMGMGMGSGFYSGFGLGYSMMYGSPYSMLGFGYGLGSMYSPYGYYGYGGGYGGYYGGTGVVTDSRATAYGRHPSRSSSLNNNYVSSNTRNDASIVGSNGRVREGGRMRTDSQPNYYNSGWRNSSNYTNTRGSSGYGNNPSWSGGNTGGSNWGGGNTRSSWDSSFGSGSRGSFGGGHTGGGFSGGGGGGGGGGGHSRGRN